MMYKNPWYKRAAAWLEDRRDAMLGLPKKKLVFFERPGIGIFDADKVRKDEQYSIAKEYFQTLKNMGQIRDFSNVQVNIKTGEVRATITPVHHPRNIVITVGEMLSDTYDDGL